MQIQAWKSWRLILLVPLLLVAACATAPDSGGSSKWDKPVAEIQNTFDRSLAAYENGDQATAMQLAQDAYFNVMESSGMEAAIRLRISVQRNAEIEAGFTQVRQLIRAGASPAEVRAAVSRVMAMLRQDAARLGASSQSSPTADFLASFLIIVREGFEAILIVGAIIAYLIKSGNGHRVRTIYQSALLAIVASIATAFVVSYLFTASGASRELLEGATVMLAVAVLFFTSFWLLSKTQEQQWRQYIQSKVGQSLTTGSTTALWMAAFLAVYREGAETVLFSQALISGTQGNDIGATGLGLAAGVLVLAIIFIAIRWGSLRIPIRPFFLGTGIFLYYMAFVFAGQGIKELQEASVVRATAIPNLPVLDLLGIYPSWEGLGMQSLLVLAALVGLAYQFWLKSRLSSVQRGAAA